MIQEKYLGLKGEQKKDYKSPFTRWDEFSWIRNKPIQKDSILGLPFSPELVPLASHDVISQDSTYLLKVLAYQLLAHLQSTTKLELAYINLGCSDLVQGKVPVSLTQEQRNDALRICSDECGHALMVEILSTQVEETFGLNRFEVESPAFARTIDEIIEQNKTRVSPTLIRIFFVTIVETLVTKLFTELPHDERVAPLVRAVIGDHAADEALHRVYFRNLFPLLWNNLSPVEQEEVGQILPNLLRGFLKPDICNQYKILSILGFNPRKATEIIEDIYRPEKVLDEVRKSAKPCLKIFEEAGVFSSSSIKQCFADNQLL
ncbi:MAG: diiron oxygenase [Stigonema ocellatum SAG 48.90 = DSM 106950]|nr:diiron oxygenase [Stigonema ocellatum SAG 48.90 = DSM 106950]